MERGRARSARDWPGTGEAAARFVPGYGNLAPGYGNPSEAADMTLRQENVSSWDANVATKPRRPLALPITGLILLAVLTPLQEYWAAQVLLVPLLLIIPGIILLRILRVPGEAVATNPVYLPSASLVLLMSSGLAVDLIGPHLGITQPLRMLPLLVGLEIVCMVLLACSVNARPETEIPWDSLSRPASQAWPLILPLLGAAGALRLNSGHSDHVAVIALSASVGLLVVGFLLAPKFNEIVSAVIVYATSLSMLWSFSLRGDLVYGFDIASEYYALQQTAQAGVWHVVHPGDAYGAMLSVTVLPTELHALTGISTLLVFKVVYPAIAALFPVAVYSLSRRVLARRWAFLASGLVIMQQPFYQEFPALARQEIATVLFVALVSAILDATATRRTQWALVSLLSLGMVVSHYSTTYLAITLFAIAVVLQFAVSWFKRVARVNGAMVLALVVSLTAAFLWYGTLTKSTSNVSQFVVATQQHGLNLLPNHSGNLLKSYLQGEETQELSASQYQKYISSYYAAHMPYVTPLPQADLPQYALQPAVDPTPSVTWQLGASVVNLATLLIQQLTNLLAGIGALVLAFRRKVPGIARQVGIVALAGMVILALVRVSGTIAEAYNPERAFLQMMIVLGAAVCWLLPGLGARWKLTRPAILTVCAGSLAVFMAASSGLSNVLLGGATDTNLANSFGDYQDFDMSAPEIASATWLNNAAPPGQIIYADYYAQLRLTTVVGDRPAVLGDITPETLDQNSWVYASRTNIVNNIAQSDTGGYYAIYSFPKSFLEAYFNTVYTNGTSEVFHR